MVFCTFVGHYFYKLKHTLMRCKHCGMLGLAKVQKLYNCYSFDHLPWLEYYFQNIKKEKEEGRERKAQLVCETVL